MPTNDSLLSIVTSMQLFAPSRASSGIQSVCCMPDEAQDGRNVALK